MQPGRLPFVFLAMLSLIAGLIAGLQRIGWSLPVVGVASSHGAIMIGGFLGTLITLEKIIPLKKKFLFVIPVVSATSVLLFFLGFPVYAMSFLLVASSGLSILFLLYWLRERSLIYVLMFTGAACWLTGNIVFIVNNFYPLAVPWWMAFILLIITAERLELMKFLPVSAMQKSLFAVTLTIFLIGCILTFHGRGTYFAAAALIGTSIWLMRHDVVGINLKKDGLTKYVGITLLTGYCALLLSGLLLPFVVSEPLGYDVFVHAFFVGFAFSMIFAHGPIILPGILGITAKPYHPILYLWLGVLHASWLLRIFADIALEMQLRKYSGLISTVAIIGYFLSVAVITTRTQRAKAL